MPRFRSTGSSAREAPLNQQIACKNHAWEFGVDSPEITIGSGPINSCGCSPLAGSVSTRRPAGTSC
jgi:hypothetical protein